MSRNFRTSRMSLKKRPLRYPTSNELKSWLIIESKRGCRLPSCSIQGGPEKFARHHWDFRGKEKEDPIQNPKVIHLVCHYPCHGRVHKIAGITICYLEILISVEMAPLIQKIARILEETSENINFVLREEFKPAGLVQIKKGNAP